MKVKNKYRYDYLALNLRAKVVIRFRTFSKKVARSHAETLTAMMDFFEWHNYSPHQRFGKNVIAGQKKNRKRIEAVIAIIKSVEKSQNIPIMNIEAMLKSLFKEEKIELVSNRFGKDFLKIEITREELARFKRGLKDS